MPHGLDIGTGAIRAARDGPDGVTVASQPPVALRIDGETLEDADGSAVDTDLEDALSVTVDGTAYVLGSDAERLADGRNDDLEPLLSRGFLAANEYADAALESLVRSVLPAEGDDRLCYTIPGTLVGGEEATRDHRDAVATVLEDLGYDATPVSKGFAVVYDQFGDDNYTGLGVCVEAETTSVALAYYGVPVLAFSLAKGRDWLVENAAGATGHAPSQVAGVLEDFALDPDLEGTDIENALAAAHDDLCEALIDAIRDAAATADLEQGLSVPVALAGDGATTGFEALLGGRLDAADLPFSVREVGLTENRDESAARGALAAARDDVDAYEAVTWSGDATAGAPADGAAGDRTDADGNGADGSAGDGSLAALDAGTAADADGATEDSAQTTLSFDDAALESAADATRADDAIDQLFDRLADRDAEIESVTATVEDLRDEIAAVESEAAADDDVAALESDLETHRGELDELADARAELEAEVAELEGTLEAELSDLEADLAADLDETEDDLRETLTALEDELGALEADAATERNAIENDVDAVRDDLASTAGDVESLADDLEGAVGRITDAETETADDRIELEDLRARLEDLDADFEEVRPEIDALDAGLEDVRGSVAAIEDEIESVTVELETLDEGISDEYDELRDDVDALEPELSAVAERTETVDSRVADLAERLDTRAERTDDRLDDLEDGLADDEARADEIASIRERLDGVPERIGALEVAVDDLRDEHDDLQGVRETCGNLEATTDAHGDALVETSDGLASLEERVDAIDERVDGLETSASDDGEEQVPGEQGGGEDVDALADRVRDLEDRLEKERTESGDLAALEDDLESVRDRVSALADRLDDRTSSGSPAGEEQIEGAGTSAGDGSADGAGASSPRRTVLTPLLAGGAGAGLLVAASVAVQGNVSGSIYAAVVGVVLLAGALLASQ